MKLTIKTVSIREMLLMSTETARYIEFIFARGVCADHQSTMSPREVFLDLSIWLVLDTQCFPLFHAVQPAATLEQAR